MKALKKVVLVLLLLPILLLLISLFLPSKYHVERTTVIKAPPEAIYPWLAQLKKWPEWTVWNTTMDPTLTYTYSGPAEGAGAEMSWTGKKLGNGAMKLTSSDPKSGVKFDLNIGDGKMLANGSISPEVFEGGTKVTWVVEGSWGFNPVLRYLGLFADKLMGGDFHKNLEGLKKTAEAKGS
jgi:hypothetical protein